MVENITSSLKAKLYENSTTSFMASFVISAIFLNHKYLLIYFSEYDNLNEKLTLLKYNYLGIDYILYYPIAFALFYTIIFPLGHHIILLVSEFHKVLSKRIKMWVQGKKPIDEEDKKHFVNEIYKLKETVHKKEEFVSKIEKETKIKIIEKEEKIQELESKINIYENENTTLNEKITKLEEKAIEEEKIQEELTSSKTEINELNKKIENLRSLNSSLEKEKKDILNNNKLFADRNQELSDKNNKLIDEEKILIHKIKELEEKQENSIKLIETNAELNTMITDIKEKNKKLENLLSINNIGINFKNDYNLSNNEINILEQLGINHYKSKSLDYENFITTISNWTKLARILVEEIVPALMEKQYLVATATSLRHVSITPFGRKTILEIMNSTTEN